MPAETKVIDKATCELIAHVLQSKWCPNASEQELLRENEYCTGEVQRRRSQAGRPQPAGNFRRFAFSSLFRSTTNGPVVNERGVEQRLSAWETYGRVYHCVRAPGIALTAYVERLSRYFQCSPECFPIALALIDRFVESTEVAVDGRNVFRLFLAALLAATKSREDIWHTTSYYAHVGGVSPLELRSLETHFLFSVGWNLIVQEHLYNQIALGIGMSAVVSRPPAPFRCLPMFLPVEESTRMNSPFPRNSSEQSLSQAGESCTISVLGGTVVRTLSLRTDGGRSLYLPTSQPSPAASVDDLAEYFHVARTSPLSRSRAEAFASGL